MAVSILLPSARKTLFSCCTRDLKFPRNKIVRHNSTGSGKFLEHLKDRTLIKIGGPEAADFLQGLITNDMRHFEDGSANIYTLFLNIKGRVMCDSIIYKTLEKEIFYVECDTELAENVQRHLKMYKIRRKIDIEPMANKMRVWSTFDRGDDGASATYSDKRPLEGQIFPCGTLKNKSSKLIDNIMIYEDPRIPEKSLRILSNVEVDRESIAKHLDFEVAESGQATNYKSFRYRLGIAEGATDLPIGKALPLEINCDYLHGVSFHKGCYIGQELTARSHHTGVVRKRIMPLLIENSTDQTFAYDENIVNEVGKSVGKFRAGEGKLAIGLMRITEALNAQSLRILDCTVNVAIPKWWPKEISNDEATLKGVK